MRADSLVARDAPRYVWGMNAKRRSRHQPPDPASLARKASGGKKTGIQPEPRAQFAVEAELWFSDCASVTSLCGIGSAYLFLPRVWRREKACGAHQPRSTSSLSSVRLAGARKSRVSTPRGRTLAAHDGPKSPRPTSLLQRAGRRAQGLRRHHVAPDRPSIETGSEYQ